LVVSAGLSGSVFLWTGGAPLSQAPATVSTTLVPAIASALVFYVSNVLLVSLAVGLMTNQPYGRVLGQLGFLSYGSSLLVLALLGLLIAHLLSIQSWASLLLLTLPFMAARRTFRVYVELTEAYASTVRSLVTAIEAKDPYTRGHSERVAEYAQAIAEQMGLPQPDVQMLERAALLHDVGKIGISLDTLVSPDELSEDEMRAIRRHPGLGADLIADVDFLHDIVDVVRCHHERCDGGGYPDGILGEDIPLLARILAAADSFDAMTSDRAYRPGMPFEQAIEELRRVAGEQLDERVVASFVEVLRSDELGAMAP
jgi:putative nucleotidyltransferase with HDIG domain